MILTGKATEQSAGQDAPGVVERLRRVLTTGEFARLAEVYASDAVLEANVPMWRFRRRGPEAIIGQLRHWYSGPVPLLSWRTRPSGWGAVVELEEGEGEGEDRIYSRSLHLFLTEGDRIREHVVYCTGVWDAETVAHHKEHEPEG